MKMTNDEYKEFAGQHAPRSWAGRNMLRAFVSGGAICAAGQALTNLYLYICMEMDSACAACSVTLIFIGALLTGLGVYDDMARFSGAGTLVPITGFANSVVAPAIEYKTEGMILGTAAKMFIISGPVIVYGISSGVIYGILLLIFGAV